MCPKGSGPHPAAKQGRSFRVAALKLPGSLCAQGGPSHILQQNKAVLFVWLLSKLGSESSDRKMDPRVLVCAQRGRGHILQQSRAVLVVCLLQAIRGPCVPKAVKATFCRKTGPFFPCKDGGRTVPSRTPIKLEISPAVMCDIRCQNRHILQQNSAGSLSFCVRACFKLDEYHLHYHVHMLLYWKRLRT